MIEINLLPVREARRSAAVRKHGIMLAASAIGAAVVCVGMHMAVAAQISSERSSIAKAEVELKELENTLKEVKRFRKEKEEIEAKLAVIDRLERGRQRPVKILDDLSERTPERLWLHEMSLKNGVLELEGASTDNEVVAGFMTSLEESPLLSNVELKETSLKEEKGLKLTEFKITCADTAHLEARRAKARADAKKSKGKKKKKRRRR